MRELKIKLIIIYLIIFYYLFIFRFVVKKNDYLINENAQYFKLYLIFNEMPLNHEDSLFKDEKKNILKTISKYINKNVTSIKKIIYESTARFGNILLLINKIIFFCEIIGCNEITLKGESFWFITNNIFIDDYNLTINRYNNKNHLNNTNNEETVYFNKYDVFFYGFKIKPKIRIHLLKNEIIKNLPFLNISKTDLYIHIRSGDIFTTCIHKPYAQPPLCFYKSIFDNFNFSSIYIITENKNNPVINKLLSKFENIIYLKHDLKYDLSCLINSYNLVGSISSFLYTIIMLNPNLKNFFEYNLMTIHQKIVQNHYDLFKFPKSFTTYMMEPSKEYRETMRYWKNNRKQRKLMIKKKCINTFKIINI